MKKTKIVFLLASVLFAPLVAQPAAPAPAQTDQSNPMAAWTVEALRAAQEYVNLLDQGHYEQSWQVGAQIFQRTMNQKEWATALALSRGKLGRMISRTLKDEKPAFDPKGLPKGAYMVVEFNTAFEKAPKSGELLTLMRERDGKWKVLTYQVN